MGTREYDLARLTRHWISSTRIYTLIVGADNGTVSIIGGLLEAGMEDGGYKGAEEREAQ